MMIHSVDSGWTGRSVSAPQHMDVSLARGARNESACRVFLATGATHEQTD